MSTSRPTFTPDNGVKPTACKTMADVRFAVWQLTNNSTALVAVVDGEVCQNGEALGTIDGTPDGE